MRKYRIITLPVLLFILASCAGVLNMYNLFDVTEKNYSLKGNRIAVFAADKSRGSGWIAQHATHFINKETKLKAMPQKRIKKTIRSYPENIQGPFDSAYIEIEENYAKSDMKKLISIGKKLRVNYLFSIWAPTGNRTPGTLSKREELHAIYQVIEIPSGKVIARGKWLFYHASGLVLGKSRENMSETVQVYMEYVVRQMVAKLDIAN